MGNGTPPRMTKELIAELSQKYITAYEMITGRQFKEFDYPIEKRIEASLSSKMTYSSVGDNYSTKDPIKKLAQAAARKTGVNLKKNGFLEIESSRGESAFVWKQGNVHMASVVEGLGTKNLVADGMREVTLTSSGATPLVVHAYWAIENNEWLLDEE